MRPHTQQTPSLEEPPLKADSWMVYHLNDTGHPHHKTQKSPDWFFSTMCSSVQILNSEQLASHNESSREVSKEQTTEVKAATQHLPTRLPAAPCLPL